MNLFYLAEGPFLWGAFVVLIMSVLIRLVLFFYGMIYHKIRPSFVQHLKVSGLSLVRSILPFHMEAITRPLWVFLRYVFHICLIGFPIFYSGHVVLWEESRFEWSWQSIPDEWVDRITLVLLAFFLFFLIRRLLLKQIRSESGMLDYALILIAGLPYLTGYLYSHGILDHIGFFRDNMLLFHMFSGEVMLISVACLFWTVRLRPNRCTGCAACSVGCPTGTLTAHDRGNFRHFEITNSRCISCGSCVKRCPEDAAQFRHQFSITMLFQLRPMEKRRVELAACDQCGKLFLPIPQMNHINRILTDKNIELSLIGTCEQCKMRHHHGASGISI